MREFIQHPENLKLFKDSNTNLIGFQADISDDKFNVFKISKVSLVDRYVVYPSGINIRGMSYTTMYLSEFIISFIPPMLFIIYNNILKRKIIDKKKYLRKQFRFIDDKSQTFRINNKIYNY